MTDRITIKVPPRSLTVTKQEDGTWEAAEKVSPIKLSVRSQLRKEQAVLAVVEFMEGS